VGVNTVARGLGEQARAQHRAITLESASQQYVSQGAGEFRVWNSHIICTALPALTVGADRTWQSPLLRKPILAHCVSQRTIAQPKLTLARNAGGSGRGPSTWTSIEQTTASNPRRSHSLSAATARERYERISEGNASAGQASRPVRLKFRR
jgi:hypothetical protein